MVIDIDLAKFVRSGEFDFLRSGITKEEILHSHFDPEDWGPTRDKNSAPIWRYGNFELHFEEAGELAFVFNDHVDKLEGGQSIQVTNPWIFRTGSRPILIDTIHALVRDHIDFSKEANSIGQSLIRVPSSRLEFRFDGNDRDGVGHQVTGPALFPMVAFLRR